jgi:mono/diheme cytochrome c family protein
MKAHRFLVFIFSCSMLFSSFSSAALFAQTKADGSLVTNAIFKKDCAKCHGKTAEGRHFGGPSLISDKTSAASDDELRNVISNGKGRMPKYAGKLTPEEISTLVEQIKAVNKK